MPWFRTVREKRLWLATAIVVGGIYATLGLARALAGTLRAAGVLEASFGLGALLALATLVVLAFRLRLGGIEIGILLGVVTTYLLLAVRMATPEERTHLVEYAVVGALVHAALRERVGIRGPVLAPACLALALTALIGLVDEAIQWLIPSRVFDWRDVGFNLFAGTVAVGAGVLVAWVRRNAAHSTP